MRPGILFGVIFAWCVCTGGRFTALFLEEVAQFSESVIGLAFGLQIFFGTIFAGIGSKKADELEIRYPSRGRLIFLMALVFFANLGFQIHYVVYYYTKNDDLVNENSITSSMNRTAMLHILARVMFSICTALVFPILDGISLTYLKETQANEAEYGKERLFGAVGWAIASIAIGPVLDKYGYLDVFYWTSSISTVICIYVIYLYMRSQPHRLQILQCGIDGELNEVEANADEVESPNPELEMKQLNANNDANENHTISELQTKQEKGESILILKSMLSTVAGVGFIFSTITLSMGTSVVENLIFLFFQKLGGSNTICGLSVLVTVMFEIPIFQYSGKILENFGAEALQKIACIAYVIRVIGYTFIPKDHVALVLLFEPLHGVTYACSKTSSVEFASKLSPPGFESTGQGIMSSLQGMGVIFGLSMGGWIEDTFSAVILYRSYAGIVGVGLLIFYMTSFLEQRRKETTPYSRLPKQSLSSDSV